MSDTHGKQSEGWIGVDLDGTLAHYDKWVSPAHIGEPIPKMLNRVFDWNAAGIEVRIFTARVSEDADPETRQLALDAINDWCLRHFGRVFPVTYKKDFSMLELWDDRAVQVNKNTGERADGKP